MSNKRDRSSFPWGIAAGIAVALAVTGGGLAWFTTQYVKSPSPTVTTEPTPSPPVAKPTPSPTESVIIETPAATETVAVYWLKPSADRTELQPISITIQKSNDQSELLTKAFENLLTTPSNSDYITALPKDTKLLGLKVDDKGVHVNLSQQFTKEDGSSLMIGRLAQVIYTASSLEPNVPVWISVGGKPLEILGEGHGLIVDQPMTRQIFDENYGL